MDDDLRQILAIGFARRRRFAGTWRYARRIALLTLLAVVAVGVFAVVDAGDDPRPVPGGDAPAGGATLGVAPAVAPTPAPAPRTGARDLAAQRAARDDRAIDRVLAHTPVVSVGGGRRREVALTFDDGPGPYTLRLVRILQRLRAPATFFQLGFSEHWFTAAERAIVADPRFVIGDHTQSHPHMGSLPAAAQAAEIDAAARTIRRAGHRAPRLFRPPYGSYNAATLAQLRRRKMLMVLWTVDSEDYLRPGVKRIVRRVMSGVRPGAIILMHDAGGERSQTLAAVPRIVRALRKRGYRLVTVPRLLRENPPPRRQPATRPGVG
jgi:peptidoglycan/xylan/chitin deacetylase (PgdA/CDA1 family)